MRISSYSIFILPVVLLLCSSVILINAIYETYLDLELLFQHFPGSFIMPAATGTGLYLILLGLNRLLPYKVLQLSTFALPLILYGLTRLSPHSFLVVFPEYVVSGIFLLWATYLLRTRYFAKLTDNEITLCNLFLEKSRLPLGTITELSYKRNPLSIFREFALLSFSKKIGISFYADDDREYEIHVFMRMFKTRRILDEIIKRAADSSNSNIRQYL